MKTVSPTRLTNHRALILASSIASIFAAQKATASSATWAGLTDALWALDGNWSAAPFPGLADTATFDGAGNGNVIIDLGAGVTVGNIAFDTAAVAAYTLGSGAVNSQSLTLGNAGAISMGATVAANQTIGAALTLGNDGTAQTFSLSNASLTNSLTLAGDILGSAGSGLKAVSIGGSGATVLSGIISNGTGGTVGITKVGNGALSLSNAANTFSGGITLGANTGVTTATMAAGTSVSGLGTGAVSIGAGSTLNLLSANTVGAATTINNVFSGGGLLKLTFTNATPTNTILNSISGFSGTIQLSNTGVNGDKLSTNGNYGNVAASLIVDSGSQLFVTGTSTTNFNGGISLNGTGNSENRGAIRLGVGVIGGNITLAGNSTIGLDNNTNGVITGGISAGVAGTQTLMFGGSQNGNGTLSGVLSDGAGQFALTKNNTGTLSLTNANTYTGATTVGGGRLQLGLGGTTGSLPLGSAVSVASGASLVFNRSNAMADGVDFGAITGAGNVAQNGTGTTTFGTATAQVYTGQTQVNRGTLTLDFANMATATNMIDAGSTLNLGGGTLSLLGKNSGATAQTFNGATFSAGRSTVSPNRNGGTSTTVTLGALTNNAGSTVFFTPATAWAVGANSTTAGVPSTTEIVTITGATRNGTAITMPGAGAFAYVGANVFYGTGAAARYVIVRGAAAGPYQLAGAPTTTAFALTGGSATAVHSTGATPGATLTLTGATANYALIGNNSGGLTIANGGFAYTMNGYLGIGAGATTMSGAGAVTIGAEKDFVVNLAAAGNLTISSAIVNNGANASSMTNSSTGSGILTMNGANTYSGGTFFNGGMTSIAADANLGAVPGAASPGNLTFNGGTLRIVPTAAVTINANRGIALGANGGTILNNAAFGVTVNGIIAGIGGLTFSHTSTANIAVGGANTFSGGATIGGTGQIVPTNNAAFGTGILTLGGGQLRAGLAANITLNNPVNVAVDTTFPTVAGERSLIFGGPASLNGTRTFTVNVGATVVGERVQFSSAINESAVGSGLIKAGTGNLTLNGLNTFTGPTTINAGRVNYTRNFSLYANNPASWTDTSITVANGGTLSLTVGSGVSDFTSANVDTIAALGSATGGFQTGSTLGLDTTNGNFTHAGVLANPNSGANALGIIKLGANTLTITGTNTYTGSTSVGGGLLVAGNPAAFGPAGNTIFLQSPAPQTSGALEFATDTSANAYHLSTSSSFVHNITSNRATPGAGIIHNLGNLIAGNNVHNFTAGTNVTSGTAGLTFTGLNLSGGAAATVTLNPTTATVAITGASNIGLNNQAKTLALDGTIAGNSISGDITNGLNTLTLTKSNTSSWTLSGNNSYTGATNVNAGTLILSGTNTGTGATNVVGGTLQAGANGALNPNSAVVMTDAAAAILDLNGMTGTIASLAGGGALGGNVLLGSGTLSTGDSGTATYSGNISGTGNLIKTGIGTFVIAAAQSYTGNTTLNAGTLLNQATIASSATTVANTGTLGGIGTFSGAVTINSGGMLSPATALTAGTITMGSLTLDAGSGLAYEFGGTNDLVAVTNANGLTINGGALSLYATGGVSALTANGIYTLFSYATGFGGALTNLSIANSQAGKTYSVADAGGTITLTIGTATASEWNGGAADGLWTTAGNWSAGTPNSVGAVATLGVIPVVPTSVAVDGAKTVGSIIFDNVNSYTVTGGAGDSIALENGIAAAAISTVTGNHTISAPIALNGAANITPGTGTTLTLGGIISGAKTVSYSGAGTAVVSGANTYSAGTMLVSGILSLANGAALGTGTFTISGGTIDAASAITVINNNAQVWNGDFTFAGTNNLNLGTGAVSVPLNRIVTVAANTLTVGGAISGSFTKAGNGTLELTGNNTSTSGLSVNAGIAILSGENSARPAATNGQTIINAGGTLQLQANVGNTTAGVSTALSGERTGGQPLLLNNGSTLQLRSDSAVTFAGANNFGGLGSATVAIDVNQLTGTGTNNVITLAPGGFNVNNTTINVTGGNGYSLRLPAITSVSGANTSTFNGNTVPISIGSYTASAGGNHFLGLGGSNTANVVTGIISNGSAGSMGIVKTGSGTWDVQGANTNTGNITVSEGTLKLTGAKTGVSGIITVANQPGLNATLEITNGTYTIGGAATRINVGSAPTTPVTATVNQSGGAVVFTAAGGDQVLIGQNAGVGNTGIYNLSGGSITTAASTARGIILGVNANATGNFNLSGTGTLNMTSASGGGGDAILQIGRSESAADSTTTHFNQTGGTANVGILAIGGNGATSINLDSTLTITGGTFSANSFTLLARGNNNIANINIGGTADVTLPAFPTARGTGSTATINFDGGTLRPLAASGTYISGAISAFIKAGGANFNVATGNNITVAPALIAHPLSTGGGLTKAGVGTLTLNGSSTYTGKTIVSAGGLTFNSIGNVGDASSALGAPTTVAEGTIDLNGILTYTGPLASTDRVINLTNAAGNASIINNGTGLLTLNGDITGTALNLLYRGSGSITMNGLIPSSHTGPVTHTETSTLTLTNPANAWTGALVVSKGIISVNSISSPGVPSAIGAGTTIVLGQDNFVNTGTFQFTGASGGSTDRAIDIQSFGANGNGGIIENTVAGQLLTLSGNITVGGSGTLPSLGLTGAGNGELTGDVLGSAPLSLTKSGTGTWTLAGFNTYTGPTAINAGTLLVSGAISGSSAVTVSSTGTLGGDGGTIGAFTATGGSTVAPGASIGTLNSGSATFNAGSAFALEINTTTTTTDLLAVTGNLSLAATNDTLLNISDLAAGIYNGTPLPFITYTGTWDGGLFTVGGVPVADEDTITVGANTFTLDYNYGGNSVALIPEPGSAALLLGGLAMLGFRRRRA